MKCPKCDANVSDTAKRCGFCGQDLSIIHHARQNSNFYYNMGLKKAEVRDLSGAISVLKKSLQFNKCNTDARNLLGLVYYEIGEIVSALGQWILSKYLQPENNRADYFIDSVQKNQTELEAANQSIKKYNVALSAVKSGSEDLAMIQLKKVVAGNPRLLRAQQLLALLYIHEEEYQKAAKCLNQARRIDYNNTTTLRYMQEIGDKTVTTDRRGNSKVKKTVKKKDPLENVTPVGSYQEEKKSFLPVVQLILGMVLGIVFSFVLIHPTLSKTSVGGSDPDGQLAAMETQISALEKEKTSLEESTEQLQKTIDDGDTEARKKLESYETLLKGVTSYTDGDTVQAAIDVSGCEETDFDSDEAKALYTKISTVTDEQITQLVSQGQNEMYTSYETAITTFKKVLALDDDNQAAMFYMGRCYQRLGKNKKAKKWYEKAIAIDSSTANAVQAQQYLEEVQVLLGESTESTETP